MAPSAQAHPTIKKGFYKPWLVEKVDLAHMAFVRTPRPVQEEDGNVEVLRDSLLALQESGQEGEILAPLKLEEDVKSDGLDYLTVLQEEACDVLTTIMNDEEEQIDAQKIPSTLLPYVEYSGHDVFKSMLVIQLNDNLFLSKDCLKRVQHSIYYNNSDDILNALSAGA